MCDVSFRTVDWTPTHFGWAPSQLSDIVMEPYQTSSVPFKILVPFFVDVASVCQLKGTRQKVHVLC